ncbi:MAG TPA: hypothetical protein VGP22_18470 [Albitalea sp.]|nr:hypothetical protein [Albitalea sp.]
MPPFPSLFDAPPDPWEWPALPFIWRHHPAPGIDVTQPCCIEAASGAGVDGLLSAIDTVAGTLVFRIDADGSVVTLPFSRLRRLTLTTPLRSAEGRLAERLPAAAQQREVRVLAAGGATLFSGRTYGHVESAVGLFLFPGLPDERQLLRVFVPRCAYERCELGPSAQDLAAEHWIAAPRELLEAIARRGRMPVLPIGQSLLELGLVTPDQLQRTLAEPAGDVPLGERMVELGVISPSALQTAIGHKMGHPVVDLTRFPIDPQAASKLPLRSAVKHRALPILIDGQRLIVAVDRPSRIVDLQALSTVGHFTLVPVLALKEQILLALTSLAPQDVRGGNLSMRAEFFSTTR